MKLSDLMKLPTWGGDIVVQKDTTKFRLSEDGSKLEFPYKGITFTVVDQDIRMNADGGMFIYVKARNRMSRLLPAGIRIYALDTSGRTFLPRDLDAYLPPIVLQGYYGTAHHGVMAY